MDLRLKLCSSIATLRNDQNCGDRLTNLPDELLIRILSLLPTKDAAVTCNLCKRMRSILPLITSLDFDHSPISHCRLHPYATHRFPSFVTFVDNVLSAYQSKYLTRFKLGVGEDFMAESCDDCKSNLGKKSYCCPDLKASQINAWIAFPFTRVGLRELDLRIQVKQPADCLLPLEIFTCETLEVLKLDANLSLGRTSTMSSFHLPRLKLLQLRVPVIFEVGFVTRLVSSCPSLEDLMVDVVWNQTCFINISSHSLRKLSLFVHNYDDIEEDDNRLVLINTPNLEYLKYTDSIPLQYSVPNMNSLVEADVCLEHCTFGPSEASLVQVLTLIRALSNARHLTLAGSCIVDLGRVDLKGRLPIFHNLNCLELRYNFNCWDKLLLSFLYCSPVLETLVFPQGLVRPGGGTWTGHYYQDERDFYRKSLAIIPSCCRNYLKRIVIKYYHGSVREICLIQFLLRHALALQELVVFRSKYAKADGMVLENALRSNLSRVSIASSVQVLFTA